jgi:dTDP-4-dehydrorhamnose reductase
MISPNKIIVLGTGFVAQAYLRILHCLGYFPAVLSRSWCNYSDPCILRERISSFGPGFVINAAGFTGKSVDCCERDKDQCYHANVTLAREIAIACKDYRMRLIHISSGCIFNGAGPFSEADEPQMFPQAQSFYAVCKKHAEDAVLESGADAFIFRIRMPFSHFRHPRNWLIKLSEYPQILDGVNSVTWLDEFAMRSWQVSEKGEPGIYHCVQPGPVSTADVARMLFKAGLRNLPVTLFDPAEFLKQHVRRSEAILSCEKFEAAYKTKSTDAVSALTWCIEQLANDKV